MAYSCTNKPSGEVNSIERLYIHKDLGIPYIEDVNKNKYILDTGAEISILFDSTFIKEDFFSKIGLKKMIINGKETSSLTGINEKIIFKSFTLEGEKFIYVSENVLLSSDSTIKGLIGMNILSKNNSYWNISKGEFIINYDSLNIIKPKLILEYKKNKLPIVNAVINTTPIDSILLDTGHSLAVVLPLNFISKYGIESKKLLRDEIANFHSTKINSFYYNIDTLKINNYLLHYKQPIPFAFSDFNKKTALLGLPFFMHWDYFTIDISKKEFHFYKE